MGNSCSVEGVLPGRRSDLKVCLREAAVFAGQAPEHASEREEDPIENLEKRRRARLQTITDEDGGHVLVHMNMQVCLLLRVMSTAINRATTLLAGRDSARVQQCRKHSWIPPR
jgi:hypothetical protein